MEGHRSRGGQSGGGTRSFHDGQERSGPGSGLGGDVVGLQHHAEDEIPYRHAIAGLKADGIGQIRLNGLRRDRDEFAEVDLPQLAPVQHDHGGGNLGQTGHLPLVPRAADLEHVAAGGVGSFAVQLARWKGAQVIGTTGAANVDFVRSLGAETVVDYTSTPLEQVVHDVDLVLDTVGGQALASAWSVIKRGGMLISIAGQPSQEIARESGIRALFFSGGRPSSERLRTIAQMIEEGHVKVTLARIFPLREANLAHELSQSGHGRGRIVLHIAD